jgi:hypothetical protein
MPTWRRIGRQLWGGGGIAVGAIDARGFGGTGAAKTYAEEGSAQTRALRDFHRGSSWMDVAMSL